MDLPKRVGTFVTFMFSRSAWGKRFVFNSSIMFWSAVFSCELLCACGGSNAAPSGNSGTPSQAATPTIASTAALNGAVIVSLATTTSGATIRYTVDGSTPTSSSAMYEGPFLVASNLTVKAIAQGSGAASDV